MEQAKGHPGSEEANRVDHLHRRHHHRRHPPLGAKEDKEAEQEDRCGFPEGTLKFLQSGFQKLFTASQASSFKKSLISGFRKNFVALGFSKVSTKASVFLDFQ